LVGLRGADVLACESLAVIRAALDGDGCLREDRADAGQAEGSDDGEVLEGHFVGLVLSCGL
jgi:hypothetical protein